MIKICHYCNVYTTIQHILVDCPSYIRARQIMISDLNININDLTEAHLLNDTFDHSKLFTYLKTINYYNRI